jgi:cytochrome c nitrite reductase small subunit
MKFGLKQPMAKQPLLTQKRMLLGAFFGILAGVPAGVGLFTFVYARGGSYMTDKPTACANCHVMQDHYDAWTKSSHHSVAVCNDCHTPPGLVQKYMVKALNGYHHSFAFTTGKFHEPIQITQRNLDIAEKSCRKCHQDIVEAIEGPHNQIGRTSCIRCHSTVGHME